MYVCMYVCICVLYVYFNGEDICMYMYVLDFRKKEEGWCGWISSYLRMTFCVGAMKF